MPAMAAASGVSGFEKLTHRHAVKLSPPTGVSVEECVGEIVGHGSMKSTSRMNVVVVVVFVDRSLTVKLVVAGVAINGELMPAFPPQTQLKG